MPVTTYNDAVVIAHPPDWRQPVEWSRSWDTRIESAVTGSEVRVGVRLKPREKIRFRLVPYDLRERQALCLRLKAAAKAGLALVPHWGRGATLAAAASGTTVTVDADTFTAQPGDVVIILTGDIEGFDDFELAQVASHGSKTLTLTAPLSGSYPAGTRVYPTIAGKVTVGELDALDDWRQAVTVEVQQLRTAPLAPPVIVDPEPESPSSDYWLLGAPVPKFGLGGPFDHWLDGAPLVQP